VAAALPLIESVVDPNASPPSRVIAVVETTEATPVPGVDARAAFEEFFRAEYRSVVRALVIVAGSLQAAEDLAQDAFARTFERWDRVRAMAAPAGYVYRAALNLHRSRLRRAAVAVRLGGRVGPQGPGDGGGGDPSAGHEVREMLRSLPATQREALMLVEWLGYSAEEAASILGIRPVSVRGRLHRARASLRTRFGGEDD
jgi:RNA polymerase sigma-70 factor, ECF subfamily